MNIPWRDLCDRMARVEDPEQFARDHGLALMVRFGNIDCYPPNPGQEAMLEAIRALGYEVPEGEGVVITTYDSPLID